MESLLREYAEKKPVFKQLDLQMQIGEQLGSMILEKQESAREILDSFTNMAPTKFERVMKSKTTTVGDTTRESVHEAPYLHLVKAKERKENDPAILITNEHVRLSVYMRTVRELMTKLHGMSFEQYRMFRDEFNDQMYDELRENDKQVRQSRHIDSEPKDTDVLDITVVGNKQNDQPDATKQPVDVLTFGHFTDRLENTIVNMATMKVVTDSNQ